MKPSFERDDLQDWPEICHKHGIDNKQKRTFELELAHSCSDVYYYKRMYHNKLSLICELRHEQTALREELKRFDVRVSARLVERVGGGSSVQDAAGYLTARRLYLKKLIRDSRYKEDKIARLAYLDLKMSIKARDAGDKMRTYYWHLQRSSTSQYNSVPYKDTMPRYTQLSMEARIEHTAAHTHVEKTIVPHALV